MGIVLYSEMLYHGGSFMFFNFFFHNLFIYLFIIIGSVYISGLEYNRLEGLEDFFLYRIFKMYFFILLGFSS